MRRGMRLRKGRMRGAWVIAAMAFATLAVRAEDTGSPFAGAVVVEQGCVQVFLDADERAWLNGNRIAVPEDRLATVTIRLGDTFVFAGGREFANNLPIAARTFDYYHLESVNGAIARFAVRRYSVRTELYLREGVRIFPNKLMATFTEMIWPQEAMDGGPWDFFGVGVESAEKTRRLK